MDTETAQFKKKAWKARKTIHVFAEEHHPSDSDTTNDADKLKALSKRKQSTSVVVPMETTNTDNIKIFKDYSDNYAEPLDSRTNDDSGSPTSASENFWHVNPGGDSGTAGVIVLIWKHNLDVEIMDLSINHINAAIKHTRGPSWLFTGYYGSPYDTDSKLSSWKVLENSALNHSLPWLVIGDFNFILHDNEKYSTQPLDNIEANIFSNKIVDLDLNDLGSVGFPFTWSNKRSGHALTEHRLDRGLANEPWLLLHPNSTVTNILAIFSDHHPILLNTNPNWRTGKIPFKFFGPWLDHKDCKDIVTECWQRNLSGSSAFIIARKLKDIKLKLKVWNKEVYGNIKTNIEESKQHLNWLQEHYFKQDRSEALKTATQVLREWKDIEEKFWKIKRRDQFIKLGDKNTIYFHRNTKCRIRRNTIDSIQDSAGNWIEDYHEIKHCFTKHFSKMAITESPEMNLEIINLIPTTITIADNNNLNRIPEDHEYAFIPGRQIDDNIAIAHETIHYMRTRRGQKGNKGSIGIKIDMAKSFDRVDWKFLITIMGKIGFNSDWCNKIMHWISTTSIAVLINGYPDKFFNPSRGMIQWDPLSPYLFLFCMEALSRTLSHVEDLGIISGVQICKNAPSINHLLFVYDCMVFCKANLSEAQNLKDILNLFGNTSGQLINSSKSSVFFSKNTDPALMPNICNLLGVQALPINDKYLGSPLFTHKRKIQSFKPGVEKMKINLSSWKNSPLNPAGREVVIKSVTSTASIYQMNCFRIPKQI
ncbi:uncharacterized protein LOC113335903 [Papaver somniferum]|uniref:uncharacterized protein LOC113335903 n=1 Tax=Papaver somniferum TaxID=3469 RepID=UPI000E704BAA|nr:uncharacterized protein LOC113335903 [Papaver somniferum]